MTDHDTDEYAAHASGPPPDSDSDLAYFTTLDAPRWAILLAAIGLACAGVALVRGAVRMIAGALNP